jgi:hypothetical protein
MVSMDTFTDRLSNSDPAAEISGEMPFPESFFQVDGIIFNAFC